MNTQLAKQKSQQLGISTVQIVREEYEILILSRLFDSPLGKKLIFRGGTALRLAYKSPRFSDDLDFSQLKAVKEADFQDWGQTLAEENPFLELAELVLKKYTLFALFKIKDPALSSIESMKIEISTRKEVWIQNKDYQLLTLQSEVTPITVLAQVATLERLEKEKLAISPPRIRDVFDLWYLGQLLSRQRPMDFSHFPHKEVKRELHKLLPLGSRKMIEPWLPKI